MGLGVIGQGVSVWLRNGSSAAAIVVGAVSVLLLVIGCSLHLRHKGYPAWLGMLGITGLLGVGAAAILPDKSSY